VFGYIRPVTAELKVKEHELYRAVYCGLCRALGKRTGCASKLTLSYDFVFLALIRMTLSKQSGHIERHRCAAHPTKKRSMLSGASELEVCAALSAALTYHKLCDDVTDSKGIKRLGAKCLMPAASGMKKRAALSSVTEEYISQRLDALSLLEAQGCDSVDRAAEPFGELMAHIFAYGYTDGSMEARIASEIGLHIGRFIYIIDAACDLDEDIKSGAYNPFKFMYKDPMAELDTDRLRTALIMELTMLERAVELMDFSLVFEYGAIIKNIIYLGLPEVIDKTLIKYSPQAENGDNR